jgi:hypothetical protein
MARGEDELAARVGGEYISSLHGSPLWILLLPFDPRALEESQPLPIPSLMAKDLVGTNRDEIGEESQKLQPNPWPGLGGTTTSGTTVYCCNAHRLLVWDLREVFSKLAAFSSYEL